MVLLNWKKYVETICCVSGVLLRYTFHSKSSLPVAFFCVMNIIGETGVARKDWEFIIFVERKNFELVERKNEI